MSDYIDRHGRYHLNGRFRDMPCPRCGARFGEDCRDQRYTTARVYMDHFHAARGAAWRNVRLAVSVVSDEYSWELTHVVLLRHAGFVSEAEAAMRKIADAMAEDARAA